MTRAALALRTALALAYPLLAHAANTRGSGLLAAVALLDLAAIVLVGPLLRGSSRAWLSIAVLVPVLAWLSRSDYATLPLLAPPVVFLALAGWLFARTLLPGRMPLVTRMACALHDTTEAGLPAAEARYTRALTGVWGALLFALCLVNLVLALFSVPEGLLARLGHPAPLPIAHAGGSLFANLLVHGVVAGAFVLEYAWRRHRFPARPYRDFPDFLRRMAALGPGFWRDVLR